MDTHGTVPKADMRVGSLYERREPFLFHYRRHPSGPERTPAPRLENLGDLDEHENIAAEDLIRGAPGAGRLVVGKYLPESLGMAAFDFRHIVPEVRDLHQCVVGSP